MRMKKFLTFLLTLAMVVSMLPAAAFAANNTATTMRLAKTQGTVAVSNATGKKVPQTGNMKLYNGYQIKTGAKSYAWISLDDTKAAKLDANSVASVQKSGQKLTLYLSAGNLFFNVKDPLKSGESFHIKTSTMTTGIRGTSGCVRVINDRVTEIHLLTGQVEVYTENPELNISKMAVLKAGQKATSLIADEAMQATGEQADIIIEKLLPEEVCGNCATEIAADPELVERIEQEAPHLLPERIAGEAEERLEADEKAAEEKQKEIDKAVENQVLPEAVDPYFEKEEAGGGGGGGGGSAAPETPEDDEIPDLIQVRTWTELVDAVAVFNENAKNITIEVVADFEQDTNNPVTVNDNGNTLTIDLTTAGFDMSSTITNNGNLVITNTAGTITTTADTVVENNGTFTLDDGTLQTLSTTDSSFVVVNNGTGTFTMAGGTLIPAAGGSAVYSTDGTINMTGGTIVVPANSEGINAERSTDVVMSGGTITVSGDNARGIYGQYYDNDFVMTGGTIDVTGAGASGIYDQNNSSGNSTVTLNGGQINVNSADGTGITAYGTMLSITNGTINVSKGKGISVTDTGCSVQMAGGRINVTGPDAMGIYGFMDTVTLTGGNIDLADTATGATGFYDSGNNHTMTVTVEDGFTLNAAATNSCGIYNQHATLTMTGGTITVSETATGATGIESSGTLEMGGTIKVEAYEGTAVRVGNVATLGQGAVITAYGTAQAVVVGGGDEPATLARPINATISAARFIDNVYQNIITPFDEFMTVTQSGSLYQLVDNWGQEIPEDSEWGRFTAQIDEFNAGTVDRTITVNGTLNPTEADLEEYPLHDIADNGATLTIDLNSNALTLPQTMFNNGKLTITGGYISSTAASTMIQNNGGTLNMAANIDLSMNQTGVANAAGTVNMTGGVINLNNLPSYGIMSDGGTVNMTGGEIVLIGAGSGTNYGIYSTNTEVNIEGGTVRESDALVNVTNDINYAVYTEGGSLNLTSGSITVHNGYAVAVDSVEDLTLTGTTVLAKNADNLLTTANSIETGFTFSAYNETHFVLENEVADDGINTWAEFMMALEAFNADNTAQTILLSGDINPSAQEVMAVTSIVVGNQNGTELTIDLSDYTLALPTTLEVIGSPLTIAGGNNGKITKDTDWDISGGPVDLISNAEALTLSGGTIEAEAGVTGIAANGDGTTEVNITGGSIVVNGGVGIDLGICGVTMESGSITVNGGTGVSVVHGAFAMNEGTIAVTNGTGVASMAATELITLNGGTITADTASAVAVDETGAIVSAAVAESMIIKATVSDNVYKGTLPAGYAVSDTADTDGYYRLTPAAEGVPMEVSDWAGFVNAVRTFNAGTSAETITLMANIDPSAEEVAAVEETYGVVLPSIGNGTSNDLTINLGAYTLGLPTTLATASSSGLVIDGTGTITTGQEWDGSAYLINNYTTLNVNSGNITGTAGVLVNNTGTLAWDLASMTVSAANGIGLVTSNMAEVGNGQLNSDTLISMTGDSATGIHVTGGTATLDGVQITTSTGATGVLVDDIAELTVDAATIYVKEGNTGIANGGTTVLNGPDLRTNIGNTGVLVNNTGDLTLNGGSMIANAQAAVRTTAGTFKMNGGDITTTAYNVGAVTVTGGTANLNDGVITVKSNGGGERGVSVSAGGTLVMDGASIVVNGHSSNANYVNYGIYDFGGSVTITSGSITANDGADGLANAYAMRSAGWNVLNVDVDNADILAESETRVIDPVPAEYGVSAETDANGYYYLTDAADTTAAEEFVIAVNEWDGTDKTITLTESITVDNDILSALGYEVLSVPDGAGTLTIDVDAYALTLGTSLMTNGNTVLTGDSTGEFRISTPGGEEAGITVNSGTTTLQGGTIVGDSTEPLIFMNDGTLIADGADIIPGSGGVGIVVNSVDTVTVSGGTIMAQGEGTIGVEVVGGTLNVEDDAYIYAGDIEAQGDDFNVIAICDHGGTINITGGEIIAEAGETRAYALYSPEYTEVTEEGEWVTRHEWRNLTVNTDNATVTGTTAANVITPEHAVYYAAVDGNGYYYLTEDETPDTGEITVTSEEEFYNAVAAHTAANNDETIILGTNLDFTQTSASGFNPSAATMNVVGDKRLTIDLAGNTLQLNSNVFSNSSDLVITDGVGGGKILSNAWYIIDNSGDLLLEKGTLVMNEPVNYMTEGTPDRAAAIRNSSTASFTLDGGAIEVTGLNINHDNYTDDQAVFALYNEGGLVEIYSGTVTATSADGTVADGYGGNAYALYATSWNDCAIDVGSATIRANSADKVMSDMQDYGFEAEAGDDGYFYLVDSAVIFVGSEEQFAAALANLPDGDVQIMLTDNVTLSDQYDIGDGETIFNAMDINLDGNDLILQGTLNNNTGLYIYDETGTGRIYSEGDSVYELINNGSTGTLVMESVELIVKESQTGIFNIGALEMRSGAITGPVVEGAEEYTYGVLYRSGAEDRTVVSDTVTVTGNITKMKVAEE